MLMKKFTFNMIELVFLLPVLFYVFCILVEPPFWYFLNNPFPLLTRSICTENRIIKFHKKSHMCEPHVMIKKYQKISHLTSIVSYL